MRIARLFQKTMFGIFVLFALIALSTSALCVYTVDRQLSQEYEANSRAIAQTIANSSMDIILNRDLSTLQSLIDQFKEIQGIKYLYIVNEDGDILAHTFVPGVPKEILASDRVKLATVQRRIPGFGEFVEVSSPILDGIAGSVHVGMDKGLIALKIQTFDRCSTPSTTITVPSFTLSCSNTPRASSTAPPLRRNSVTKPRLTR